MISAKSMVEDLGLESVRQNWSNDISKGLSLTIKANKEVSDNDIAQYIFDNFPFWIVCGLNGNVCENYGVAKSAIEGQLINIHFNREYTEGDL